MPQALTTRQQYQLSYRALRMDAIHEMQIPNMKSSYSIETGMCAPSAKRAGYPGLFCIPREIHEAARLSLCNRAGATFQNRLQFRQYLSRQWAMYDRTGMTLD